MNDSAIRGAAFYIGALTFWLCALTMSTATAQETTTRGVASGQPEELVVTARKREESLLDVPLSINALGAEQLRERKVRGLTDLTVGLPNVAMDEVGTFRGVANFSIRGLGINSSIPSIDPTVGVFLDGVYLGITNGVAFDLFDLESIEVLRGPQGILFGRNVTGGAVLVNTRKPGDEFRGRLRAALDGGGDGGLNKYLMGSLEAPLAEALSVGVSAYFNDDDGWFENQFDGADFGAFEQRMVRPVLVWSPTENLEVTARYQYAETEGDGSVSQVHTSGLGVMGTPVNFDRDSHDFSIDERGYQDTESHFVAVETRLDVGADGQITHIFGYREYESDLLSDIDSQPISMFHGAGALRSEQLSNELRYNATFAGRAELTTGVYYFNNDIDYHERRNLLGVATPDGSPALTQDGGGEYEVETLGLFAALDYALGYSFTFNAGLRYTKEDKDAKIASLALNTNAPCNVLAGTCRFDFVDDADWNSWSPKLGLTWHPSDTARVYAHWTRGFRSGGYNLRNTALDTVNLGPGPFGEETVDSYELGFKQAFAHGYLGGALFFNDIEDMQREVNLTDSRSGIVQVIKNTADAEILGIELDGVFNPSENLSLSATFGWLDPQYKQVKFDLNGDGAINSKDRDLNPPRAAKLTWSLGATHRWQAGAWGYVDSRISYAYRDKSSFTDNNQGFILSQKILDAGLDFHLANSGWTVAFYAKNLLNEVRHGGDTQLPPNLGGVPLGGAYGPLSKGRVLGGDLSYSF